MIFAIQLPSPSCGKKETTKQKPVSKVYAMSPRCMAVRKALKTEQLKRVSSFSPRKKQKTPFRSPTKRKAIPLKR
jgi:hypothetical protein